MRNNRIVPHLKIKILVCKGFGFDFGTKGGIDYKSSFRKADFSKLIKDIRNLPVKDYDLVINDFEPVTAWACKLRGKKSVALSHQSAFLSPKTPIISGIHLGAIILKNYAPATDKVGFHFERYDDFIRTPVIRSDKRDKNLRQNKEKLKKQKWFRKRKKDNKLI